MWICWLCEHQCLGKNKSQLGIDAQYQKRNERFFWALYLKPMEIVLWFSQAAHLCTGPMLCLNLLWDTWRCSRNVSPVPFTSVWKSQTALLCITAIRALPCRVISPQAERKTAFILLTPPMRLPEAAEFQNFFYFIFSPKWTKQNLVSNLNCTSNCIFA